MSSSEFGQAIGELTAPDQENALKAAAESLPENQRLTLRVLEQHRHVALQRLEVAHEQRHGASALHKRLEKRKPVIAGDSRIDDFFSEPDCLISGSLQPQDAGKKALGYRPLVEDEADHLSADHRRHISARACARDACAPSVGRP